MQALATTTPHSLKCRADIEDLFRLDVEHPEDLIDVLRHLPESLFALLQALREYGQLSRAPFGGATPQPKIDESVDEREDRNDHFPISRQRPKLEVSFAARRQK